MDVGWSRELLQRVLSSPHQHDHRTVPALDIPSSWVGRLLAVLGFLPQVGWWVELVLWVGRLLAVLGFLP